MTRDQIIENIAAELDIKRATVRKWRQRGRVPHPRRDEIRQRAEQGHGITLSRADFEVFGADAVS
jgi:predicted site-specific integrase-resolvase